MRDRSGQGMLVTLEGIDGAGKSTVAALLAKRLTVRDVLFTAEPTDSGAGQLIRQGLRGTADSPGRLEELFLFMADHARHLSRTVRPALEEGRLVICDRYSDSRAAYQGVTLQGLVPHPLQWVRSLHLPWSISPQLTLLLELDPEVAVARCRGRRSSPAEKFEGLDFLRQVSANYQRLQEMEPGRFVVLDAEEDTETLTALALEVILEAWENK